MGGRDLMACAYGSRWCLSSGKRRKVPGDRRAWSPTAPGTVTNEEVAEFLVS